jgi:cytoskeletal protein RodZ
MAESKTIDQLPVKQSVAANDLFPVDDGAQSYAMTFATLLAGIPGLTGVALTQDGKGIVFTFRDGTTQTITPTDSGKQDVLTFDNVPTQNSSNPVKSGGVFSAIGTVADAVAEETQRATGAESAIAQAAADAATAAGNAQTTADNAATAAGNAQTAAGNAATAASGAAAAVTAERERAARAESALADAIDDLGLQVVNGKLCAVYNS